MPIPSYRSFTRAAAPAVALLAAIVGGCAAPRSILADTTVRQVSVDQAFVSLGPGAPLVQSVVERPYANATRQTVALATRGTTPGENSLRVDVIGVTNSSVNHEARLPDPPLDAADLMSEAESALPAVPLRTSLTYVQNRYGPFGYAVGKSREGDECIYAWQRIATPDQDISVVNSRNTLSLRLRMCEPEKSEAQLVSAMMGLNVNVGLSGGTWTAAPKQLSPDIGATGVVVGPPEVLAAADPAAEQPVQRRARRVVRASRRSSVGVAVAAPAQSAPPPGSPVVPPPLVSPASPAPIVPPPQAAKPSPEVKP